MGGITAWKCFGHQSDTRGADGDGPRRSGLLSPLNLPTGGGGGGREELWAWPPPRLGGDRLVLVEEGLWLVVWWGGRGGLEPCTAGGGEGVEGEDGHAVLRAIDEAVSGQGQERVLVPSATLRAPPGKT